MPWSAYDADSRLLPTPRMLDHDNARRRTIDDVNSYMSSPALRIDGLIRNRISTEEDVSDGKPGASPDP